ncbi:hypothetical protein PFICI_05283 [Pestalotiopsis fici W106-1]|uniref:Uncharacterized protein n=1 Tax=Pestalotiopsis fici (strain W106-1 / CGMCC3.15140) TaxID=1229662 RepID=W3XDB6_PESFW|nr:uncharacterized protein PFICI_05283 [Pestalotiopsis fici W106-1]ETS83407.1 hypothetical protein PFICI_05283 [Pestalotiopsis fici W106-1]
MAVDLASIVVAVISLVASVIVAGLGAYFSYSTQERKARREAERLLQKYRDPLLFAAEDLQSRLGGIFHADVLSFHGKSPHHHDALYIYTSFVLGQFFAWTHILRTQTQLLPFSLEESKRLSKFIEILHSIQGVMLLNNNAEEGTAFTLWRGNQMAIGEFMAEGGSGGSAEKLCIGFYEFTRTWKADNPIGPEGGADLNTSTNTSGAGAAHYDGLRYWFKPITDGLSLLVEKGSDAPEGYRLRRLQHLLVDLITVLDPQKTRIHSKSIRRCVAAPSCPCTECQKKPGIHEGSSEKKSPFSVLTRKMDTLPV